MKVYLKYGLFALIAVALIVLVGFGVKAFTTLLNAPIEGVKKLFGEDAESKKIKEDKKEADEARVENLPQPSFPLSYSESEYHQMANTIYDAFNHSLYDDDKVVYDTLGRMLNQSDWVALQKAYGVRKLTAKLFAEHRDLVSTLREYLDTYLITWTNKFFKNRGIAEL